MVKYQSRSVMVQKVAGSTAQRVGLLSFITRPRGYKTFFVLNSVEHEILNAHKYKNIKIFGFF